jgi:mRNA-degrading endonuclease RelE of RelBE toxin-antitoxin system
LYSSKFTSDAIEDVRALPKNARNRLKREFQKTIHQNPIVCSEPLIGPLAGFRSFHFLNYRVIYRVYEDLKMIAVVGIGKKDKAHFTEIYEKLEQLARSGRLADKFLRAIRLLESL